MKRKFGFTLIELLMVVVICLTLIGCAAIQPQINTWDDQNMANTKAWAQQLMKHWLANSKVIHLELDSILDSKFPVEFKTALTRLDTLALQYNTDDARTKMTEVDAAEIAAQFWLKFLGKAAMEALNQYAPKILTAITKVIPFGIPVL